MLVLVLLASAAFQASAQTPHPDMPAVLGAIRSFRAALAAGDAATVEKLLARDASILEAGELESRKAYLEHHLQEDIKFARDRKSTRLNSSHPVSSRMPSSA